MAQRYDQLLLERLQNRDIIESRFSELFDDLIEIGSVEDKAGTRGNVGGSNSQELIDELRKHVFKKDSELQKLNEVNKVLKQASENSNNDIISLTIENNLLNEKYTQLEIEYNKLVKRWLSKVEKDVKDMNEMF